MLQFLTAIFLSAFLVFQVQPLVAKHILPWFGGTPAVWSTCLLFFQTLLLGGYLYAHWNATCLRPRRQVAVHLSLLAGAAAMLIWQWVAWGGPVLPDAGLKPLDSAMPVGRLLLALTVSVGLPYLVLSSTGPLVQAWFARAHPGRSPYRLYVLSNIGSLLALVSYPFVFEPLFKLTSQANLWTIVYLLFGVCMAGCGLPLFVRAAKGAEEVETKCEAESIEPRPAFRRKLLWVGLAGCASMMLLATTNQMCQEVAVIPFLWVLPLTLYLATFIIVFAGDRWYSRKLWGIAYLVATATTIFTLMSTLTMDIIVQVLLYSFTLFSCCMVCHGEMVRLKPAAEHLTSFYLMMSLGGALGGAFVTLAAPHLFHGFWELHVALWLGWALFLVVLFREKGNWVNQPGMTALKKATAGLLLVLAGALYWHARDAHSDAVFTERNFYGILRVRRAWWGDPEKGKLQLSHGAIIHGFQYVSKDKRTRPVSYYGPGSGVAVTLEERRKLLARTKGQKMLRVGVIGLGVGTLAAFGEPGDSFRFYEINPDVIALALGPGAYFTYIADSKAEIDIISGDARIRLERELRAGQSQEFDVLAVDAFSSDSIPAHLLTIEALELYFSHLADDGVLVLHISNRHLDLEPVVIAGATELQAHFAVVHSSGDEQGNWSSTWVLVTRSLEFATLPAILEARSNDPPAHYADLWTDDYSNLFQILD